MTRSVRTSAGAKRAPAKAVSRAGAPQDRAQGHKMARRPVARAASASRRAGRILSRGQDLGLVNSGPDESPHVSAQTVVWVKRSRYNPLRQLTPEYLSRIIDTWNNGYLREFSLMADAIKRRDPMVNISLRKREKGVARHGFEVIPKQGLDPAQKAQAEKHQKALEYFYHHCTVSHVLEQDTCGGFRLLVEQMMSAVGERYAVQEIVWQPSIDPATNQPRLTAQFNFVPVWFFETTTGKLRFIANYFSTIMGEDMAPEDWLVTIGDGLMEPLSICYLLKWAALEAEASFTERFGTPGIQGKTSAAQDSPAWNAFADAVAKFGQEWATITSQDATIELIEAKAGAGQLPFATVIERMDKYVATICRGADLSTISSGRSSQGRGSSLQGDETELLEKDDAMMITETLRKVSKIVIAQLFGDEEPLAHVQIVVPEQKNSADSISKMEFLVSSKVPVGASYARKELGIPPPVDDEQTLEASPVVPQLVQADKPSPAVALANAGHPPVDAGAGVFHANAIRKLTKAETEAVQPMLDRIAAWKDLPDSELGDAIIKFQADLPRLQAEARLHVPDIATVWEQVLGTAMLDGLADRPKTPKT